MAVDPYPIAGVTAPHVWRGTIGTSVIVITADTVWLSLVWLSNTTSSTIKVTITETTTTDSIAKNLSVEPGNPRVIESVPRNCVGLKVSSDTPTGLSGLLQY